MFHKAGPLINVSLEVIEQQDPNMLSFRRGLPDKVFRELERYLKGVRVNVQPATRGGAPKPVAISSLTKQGAREIMFKGKDGVSISVAEYFRRQSNAPLQYPDMICAKVSDFSCCFSYSLTHV
jgi:eukaryotic translation initiation factor 2C